MVSRSCCPLCRREVDCDSGAVAECPCGASLMVLAADQCAEVPVFCHHCKETYLAEPSDVGQELECGCGQSVVVPSHVLVAALRDNRGLAANVRESDSSMSERADVATEMSPARHGSDLVRDDAGRSTGTASSTHQSSKSTTKKGWFLWGMVVATPLAVGVTMFLTRSPSRPEVSEEPVAADTNVVNERPRSPAPRKELKPALLRLRDRSIELWAYDTEADEERYKTQQVQAENVEPKALSFGPKTKPRTIVLPEPRPARRQVSPVPPEKFNRSFDFAYREAMKHYDAYLKVTQPDTKGEDRKADDQKADGTRTDDKRAEDVKEKREVENTKPVSSEDKDRLLAVVLGYVEHAQRLATENRAKELQDLNYLLAFLHFNAGNLMRAGIYGEAAARWGDTSKESTYDAAMICLAASEEANATGWGDPSTPGELHRMKSIAKLIEARWPDDAQLNEIRWTLANRYDWFGMDDQARETFLSIKGKHRVSARFRAARSLWYRFLQHASVDDPNVSETVKLLEQTRKELQQSSKLLEESLEGEAPDDNVAEWVEAKSLLSRIAMRQQKYAAAKAWLTKKPFPLTGKLASSTKADPDGKPSSTSDLRARLLPQSLLTMIEAQLALGEWEQTFSTVSRFAQAAKTATPESVASLRWRVIRKMCDDLSAKTISDDLLSSTKDVIESVDADAASLSTARLIWLGNRMDELATRVELLGDSGNDLHQWVLAQPARLSEAINRRTDVSESSRNSVRLRLVSQLKRSGDLQGALEELTQILAETPNAISLQFDASLLQERIAVQSDDPNLLNVTLEGDGVVWGWARLLRICQSNAKRKARAEWTDQDRDRPLMAATHYHLCRLLQSPTNGSVAQRQIRQMITTQPEMPKDRQAILADLMKLLGDS